MNGGVPLIFLFFLPYHLPSDFQQTDEGKVKAFLLIALQVL